MTGDRLLYYVLGLLCVGLGVFVKRLRLRRGNNRYAPQWFATLWRVWLIIVGLVLIFLILAIGAAARIYQVLQMPKGGMMTMRRPQQQAR